VKDQPTAHDFTATGLFKALMHGEVSWVPWLFVLRHIKPKHLALAHLSAAVVAATTEFFPVALQLGITEMCYIHPRSLGSYGILGEKSKVHAVST
jgi:hypothetical protein